MHVLAAKLRGVPVVIRIMVDGAWEISHRKGWCGDDDIDTFQTKSYGWQVRLVRSLQVKQATFPHLAAGQQIAGLQLVAVEATDLLAHDRGGAAEAGFHSKSMRDTQVGATAVGGEAQGDVIPGLDGQYLPLWLLFAINGQRDLGTGDANERVHGGRQL